MIAGRHSEDYYPITWIGRMPVYITTLLVALHVAAMVGVTIALSMAGVAAPDESPWIYPLVYSSTAVLKHFSLWQLVSYAFVNTPTLWFAIEMWMLYVFGREVEKFVGRRAFLWLYVALILAAPVALTLLALAGVPSMIAGSGSIHFAVFVAFVVLYPRAEIFFSLQARWVALVLLGIYSAQDVVNRLWVDLGTLWLECASAIVMLRLSGATAASFDSWLPVREEEPRRESRPKPTRKEDKADVDLCDSIDPLLEKISKHGIDSLTKRERLRLEQARHALIEREKHSH
ncbi:MAG TPA: rhomboid family intramembrane serine protease [Chthoniobacterales bacterium]